MEKNPIEKTLSGDPLCAALVNSLCGIIWEAGPSGSPFHYVSSHAEKILGYPVRRWIDDPDFWRNHAHPDDLEMSLNHFRDAVARAETGDFQHRMVTADDRVVWLHNIFTVVRVNSGSVRLRGIMIDVTEQKKTEQALRASEKQFRTLCDLAPIGIFRADDTGRCMYMNPKLQEITELPPSGEPHEGFVNAVHPDERGEILRSWQESVQNKTFYSNECRVVTPAGDTKWIRILGNPLSNNHDNVFGYVGTMEDITDLRKAREEAAKMQKLESLGILAGGIAHDFNNLLTIILGSVSLAGLQSQDPAKVAKRLEDAEKATIRAKDLTQQLLTFAQGGQPVKTVVEVGGLLRQASALIPVQAQVRCEVVLPENLLPVEADEAQIAQVLRNLVVNAVQAMPGGGTLTITPENTTSLQAGKKFVRVSVADSGVGISDNHLQKIFDPYFTTRPQGSGLGLATCYSIIKKHGGKIWATSTLGKGSNFYFSLPAAEAKAAPAPAPQPQVEGSRGRILVMEDEEPVRTVVQVMLEQLGYTAECTEDGAEAVDLYLKRRLEGSPFSAVILDLTVPGGVGGKDAIGKLMEINPDVKAIVSSGYSNDPVMAKYWEYGFSGVLKKPYRPQELSSILLEVLQQP